MHNCMHLQNRHVDACHVQSTIASSHLALADYRNAKIDD